MGNVGRGGGGQGNQVPLVIAPPTHSMYLLRKSTPHNHLAPAPPPHALRHLIKPNVKSFRCMHCCFQSTCHVQMCVMQRCALCTAPRHEAAAAATVVVVMQQELLPMTMMAAQAATTTAAAATTAAATMMQQQQRKQQSVVVVTTAAGARLLLSGVPLTTLRAHSLTCCVMCSRSRCHHCRCRCLLLRQRLARGAVRWHLHHPHRCSHGAGQQRLVWCCRQQMQQLHPRHGASASCRQPRLLVLLLLLQQHATAVSLSLQDLGHSVWRGPTHACRRARLVMLGWRSCACSCLTTSTSR